MVDYSDWYIFGIANLIFAGAISRERSSTHDIFRRTIDVPSRRAGINRF
jgi:hypothetical protein